MLRGHDACFWSHDECCVLFVRRLASCAGAMLLLEGRDWNCSHPHRPAAQLTWAGMDVPDQLHLPGADSDWLCCAGNSRPLAGDAEGFACVVDSKKGMDLALPLQKD